MSALNRKNLISIAVIILTLQLIFSLNEKFTVKIPGYPEAVTKVSKEIYMNFLTSVTNPTGKERVIRGTDVKYFGVVPTFVDYFFYSSYLTLLLGYFYLDKK